MPESKEAPQKIFADTCNRLFQMKPLWKQMYMSNGLSDQACVYRMGKRSLLWKSVYSDGKIAPCSGANFCRVFALFVDCFMHEKASQKPKIKSKPEARGMMQLHVRQRDWAAFCIGLLKGLKVVSGELGPASEAWAHCLYNFMDSPDKLIIKHDLLFPIWLSKRMSRWHPPRIASTQVWNLRSTFIEGILTLLAKYFVFPRQCKSDQSRYQFLSISLPFIKMCSPCRYVSLTTQQFRLWWLTTKAPIWVLRLIPVFHGQIHHLREVLLFVDRCKPPGMDVVNCKAYHLLAIWVLKTQSYMHLLSATSLSAKQGH